MACTFQSNLIKADPNTLDINSWIKLNDKESEEWGGQKGYIFFINLTKKFKKALEYHIVTQIGL